MLTYFVLAIGLIGIVAMIIYKIPQLRELPEKHFNHSGDDLVKAEKKDSFNRSRREQKKKTHSSESKDESDQLRDDFWDKIS